MAEIKEENKVKYNFLGKSGLKVSNICLGCMTFGESQLGLPGQTDEAMSHQILDRYVEYGGNFLDTADMYGLGNSEAILGSWLHRQTRENFVIATKCRANMRQPGNVNCVGLSRRHITESIDNSLRRLQTDYVDIYQTHAFDKGTPIEETYRTLDDLVRCGKIRYAGVSNVSGWQLQKIVQTQEKLGLHPIVSLQQQYSLASRECEQEAFQVCLNEGIAVLPWSPLKGGLLTGKFKRNATPTEGRVGWYAQGNGRMPNDAWKNDKIYDIVDAATTIGKQYEKTVAQVSIRWLLQKNVVSSVIIGARTMEQLDQNMAVNGWSLSPQDMKQLDELSADKLGYPYSMLEFANADRTNPFSDYSVKSLDA